MRAEIAISAQRQLNMRRDSSFCDKSVRYNIFANGTPYSTHVACVPYPQRLASCLQQLGLWDHNYYHASWKLSIKLTHENDVLACVQYKPARL